MVLEMFGGWCADVVDRRTALIKKWMRENEMRCPCRACGDCREGLTTQTVSAIIQRGKDPLAEATVIPVIPVVCDVCANAHKANP